MSYLIHQGKHLLPPIGCDKGFYQTGQECSDGLLLAVKVNEAIFPVLFEEENGPQGSGICRHIGNVAVAPGTMDLEAPWPSSDNYSVVAKDLCLIPEHRHHGGLARVRMTDEEDALAVKHDAACMDIAAFSFCQDPTKEDLISRKKGEGMEVAPAESPFRFIVNSDIAIVVLKYRELLNIVFSYRA